MITFFPECDFKNKYINENIYEIVKQLLYDQKDEYSKFIRFSKKINERIYCNLDVLKYLLSAYFSLLKNLEKIL